MPTYEYQCTACGTSTDIRHGFRETPSEGCPTCGSALRRVFRPAPIIFRGSGFYVNDSRKGKSGSAEGAGAAGASPNAAKDGEAKPSDGGSSEAKAGGGTSTPAKSGDATSSAAKPASSGKPEAAA
ncbi:MAG: FmdB family zinc ribbon protein [Vulcanimicrobiaceae bacterium]